VVDFPVHYREYRSINKNKNKKKLPNLPVFIEYDDKDVFYGLNDGEDGKAWKLGLHDRIDIKVFD